MNLFVTNINRTVTDDALRALFAEFGEVTSAKIVKDKTTGESKGFGFVEMRNDHEATMAMKRLSNANFFDRNLLVSKAHHKV